MSTQKMIEEQFKRIETLQKQFANPKPDQDEVKLADNLRDERAQTLRKSLQSLERQRSETIARFDTEIASVKDRIATLEKPGDLDFARQISGNAKKKTPAKRATPAKAAASKATGTKKS